MRADANRRRESLAFVCRACKKYDRLIELPFDPSGIQVARERTLRLVIRENPRHIFPLDFRFVALERFQGRRVFFPSFAAIERASNEDAVASGAMRPIGRRPQLVKMQRAEKRMPFVVESGADI